MMLARLLLAISTAYLASAVFFLALGSGHRVRLVVLLGLAFPILLSPLVIPATAPFHRFLASLFSVMMLAKLYDLHVGADHGLKPNVRTFIVFLINPFSVVLRKLDQEPHPTARENLVHLARGMIGLIIGRAILIWLFRLDWEGQPFALEHSAKVVGFYLALLPGAAAAVAAWRWLGGTARDSMNQPYLARTPADFWRRYNRPMQQFFYEDIFKPVRGTRWPIRATLIVFTVSAIIHEYVFAIAIGRVQGYQAAFFLLQGFAVVATMRIKPRHASSIPWIVGTLLFNLASSVLFFASMNGVVRFYSHGLPTWLQW
jgi:MBOAT, membrane-bound O-acyltransferase family